MSTQLDTTAAARVAGLHHRHVHAHLGHTVLGADLDNRQLILSMDNGEHIRSHVLLVSIGGVPAVGWLTESGLDISDGVAVDSRLRARGAERVYAAGDLARITETHDSPGRIEHWTHALAQGRHAASTLLHDAGLGADPGVFTQPASFTLRGLRQQGQRRRPARTRRRRIPHRRLPRARIG